MSRVKNDPGTTSTSIALGLTILAAGALMVMVKYPRFGEDTELGKNRATIAKLHGQNCEFGVSGSWRPLVRYNKAVTYQVGPFFGAPEDSISPWSTKIITACESGAEVVITQEPGVGKISCRITVNGLLVNAISMREAGRIRCHHNM